MLFTRTLFLDYKHSLSTTTGISARSLSSAQHVNKKSTENSHNSFEAARNEARNSDNEAGIVIITRKDFIETNTQEKLINSIKNQKYCQTNDNYLRPHRELNSDRWIQSPMC